MDKIFVIFKVMLKVCLEFGMGAFTHRYKIRLKLLSNLCLGKQI